MYVIDGVSLASCKRISTHPLSSGLCEILGYIIHAASTSFTRIRRVWSFLSLIFVPIKSSMFSTHPLRKCYASSFGAARARSRLARALTHGASRVRSSLSQAWRLFSTLPMSIYAAPYGHVQGRQQFLSFILFDAVHVLGIQLEAA